MKTFRSGSRRWLFAPDAAATESALVDPIGEHVAARRR
jgi:hypothetical protein